MATDKKAEISAEERMRVEEARERGRKAAAELGFDPAQMSMENLCRICDGDGGEMNEADVDEDINSIVDMLLEDYQKGRDIDKMTPFSQPDQDVVEEIVQKLMMVIFPGYYRQGGAYRTRGSYAQISVTIEDVMYKLRKQIEVALLYDKNFENKTKLVRRRAAQKICVEFFKTIPTIREYANTDIQAIFDGDPAANNKDEIILAYPGLLATTIYRIAHQLFLLNVLVIPRMMTEYAHRITGVDIHPGATIGKYFMIDHATGIVVGSTSIIGDHVKVYQGVTIGALSTREGQKLHGKKRHPTIEDNVTLYSGASVLGGNTVIGEGAVIGGNSFITHSVRPGARVGIKTEMIELD